MNAKKHSMARRWLSALTLALFMVQFLPPLTTVSEAATFNDLRERAIPKDDIGMKETDLAVRKGKKPNVLFYIDNSTVMTMEPNGVTPQVVQDPATSGEWPDYADYADWDATLARFGWTFPNIRDMMRLATFGAGSLPTVAHTYEYPFHDPTYPLIAFNPYSGGVFENDTYGRDNNAANNFTGHQGSVSADMEFYSGKYFFPHVSDGDAVRKAFAAQYKQLTTYLAPVDHPFFNTSYATHNSWTVYGPNPKPGQTGPYPYSMVFRDPAYWQTGWPHAFAATSMDLVPNDSRIYMLKMALWKVFAAEHSVFNDINYGLAKNFQPSVSATSAVSLAHIRNWPFPWGLNNYLSTKNPTELQGGRYIYGGMGAGVSGENKYLGTNYSYGAQSRLGWESGGIGPVPTPNDANWNGSYAGSYHSFKAGARAHLVIPVTDADYVWEGADPVNGATVTMKHHDRFAQWIDGVNDLAPGPFEVHANPEIIPGGMNQLPYGIFPDPTEVDNLGRNLTTSRQWFLDNYFYRFANTTGDSDGVNLVFRKNSGEATGSVLDFFSPPVLHSNYSTQSQGWHDNSFPIRDVCTDNWLVLITSGQEVQPIDGSYHYTAKQAIKNLYEYSRDNNVSVANIKSDGTRTVTQGRLQNPIRTIVVGLVAKPEDEPDPALRAEIVKMRDNLQQMARAGQGYAFNDTTHDDVAKPIFVEDTNALIAELEEAIAYITLQQEDAEQGPTLDEPGFEDPADDEDTSFFTSSYSIRHNDQWIGRLSRFKITFTSSDITSVVKAWDFHEELIGKRGSRDLRIWQAGGSFVPLLENDANFQALTGMTSTLMSASNLPGGTFGTFEPHKALYRWFQGYDYSYGFGPGGTDTQFDRESMLSDPGQSGLVLLSDPKTVNTESIPGYKAWADNIASDTTLQQDPVLYTQTNDGVMHVIDPLTGEELMGILPPPVMMPWRLATLKTTETDNGKLHWINVESAENVAAKRRSRPVFLLDGPLQRKYINIEGSTNPIDWGTYLIGTMGRGGNGIFMYDVKKFDDPKLMWYKEKLAGDFLSMRASDQTPALGNPSAGDSGYMKLGLNSPKPVVGVTRTSSYLTPLASFIALSGGVQSTNLNLSANGNEGAVFLLINPKDGSVIKSFESASVKAGMRVGGGAVGAAPWMGMMTSVPTLVRSSASTYMTGKIFTADNRGNIFKVDLEDSAGTPIASGSLEIKTAATLQDSSDAVSSDASYALPYGLAAAIGTDEGLWVAGGTSDVPVRQEAGIGESYLRNKSQYIFAFNAPDNQTAAQYRNQDWKSILVESSTPGDPNLTLSKSDNKSGWYMKLWDPDAPGVNAPGYNTAEYVTSTPVVLNGILFVSTFIERPIDTMDPSLCGTRAVGGDSRLYAVDMTTGGAKLWSNGKYLTLENVKITDMNVTSSGGSTNLTVIYDKLGANNLDTLGQSSTQHVNEAGLDILNIRVPTRGSGVTLKDGQTIIYYWREY